MAVRGYRGILAAVPTTQNLRSACRWGRRSKAKTTAKARSKASLAGRQPA